MRTENGIIRADPRLRVFISAYKIAIFLPATGLPSRADVEREREQARERA